MRRSGKTTRLIDDAIQYLFTNKTLFIETSSGLSRGESSKMPNMDVKFDNVGDSKFFLAQKYFIQRLLERLNNEHQHCFEVEKTTDFIVIKVSE